MSPVDKGLRMAESLLRGQEAYFPELRRKNINVEAEITSSDVGMIRAMF